jgi:hypothetical protein
MPGGLRLPGSHAFIVEVFMFWMLLPPSANEGRHIEDDLLPRGGYWGALLHTGWDMVRHLLAHRQ